MACLWAVEHPPHLFRKESVDPDYPSLFIGSSLDALNHWIRDRKIKIKFNPMLRRAFEGAEVVSWQAWQGRSFKKRDEQKARIDSLVSLVYASGLAKWCE